MKKALINFIAVFVLFIFVSLGCGSAKEQESAVQVLSNAGGQEEENLPMAPDFTLQDLSQKPYALASYKDKRQPVILFFWTTWCPYCREELKILKEKYAQLAVDGWELFAVNVGESANKVDAFVKNYSLPFKVLLDKSTSVVKSFGVRGVPTYVFIDRDGRVKATEHYFPSEEIKEWAS